MNKKISVQNLVFTQRIFNIRIGTRITARDIFSEH